MEPHNMMGRVRARDLDVRHIVVENAVDFVLAVLREMSGQSHPKVHRSDILQLALQAEERSRLVRDLTYYSYTYYHFKTKHSVIYLGLKSLVPLQSTKREQVISRRFARDILESLKSFDLCSRLYNRNEDPTALTFLGLGLEEDARMKKRLKQMLDRVPRGMPVTLRIPFTKTPPPVSPGPTPPPLPLVGIPVSIVVNNRRIYSFELDDLLSKNPPATGNTDYEILKNQIESILPAPISPHQVIELVTVSLNDYKRIKMLFNTANAMGDDDERFALYRQLARLNIQPSTLPTIHDPMEHLKVLTPAPKAIVNSASEYLALEGGLAEHRLIPKIKPLKAVELSAIEKQLDQELPDPPLKRSQSPLTDLHHTTIRQETAVIADPTLHEERLPKHFLNSIKRIFDEFDHAKPNDTLFTVHGQPHSLSKPGLYPLTYMFLAHDGATLTGDDEVTAQQFCALHPTEAVKTSSVVQFLSHNEHFWPLVRALAPEWLAAELERMFHSYWAAGTFYQHQPQETLWSSQIVTHFDELRFIDKTLLKEKLKDFNYSSFNLFQSANMLHHAHHLNPERVCHSYFVEVLYGSLLDLQAPMRNKDQDMRPVFVQLDSLISFFYFLYQLKVNPEKTVLGRSLLTVPLGKLSEYVEHEYFPYQSAVHAPQYKLNARTLRWLLMQTQSLTVKGRVVPPLADPAHYLQTLLSNEDLMRRVALFKHKDCSLATDTLVSNVETMQLSKNRIDLRRGSTMNTDSLPSPKIEKMHWSEVEIKHVDFAELNAISAWLGECISEALVEISSLQKQAALVDKALVDPMVRKRLWEETQSLNAETYELTLAVNVADLHDNFIKRYRNLGENPETGELLHYLALALPQVPIAAHWCDFWSLNLLRCLSVRERDPWSLLAPSFIFPGDEYVPRSPHPFEKRYELDKCLVHFWMQQAEANSPTDAHSRVLRVHPIQVNHMWLSPVLADLQSSTTSLFKRLPKLSFKFAGSTQFITRTEFQLAPRADRSVVALDIERDPSPRRDMLDYFWHVVFAKAYDAQRLGKDAMASRTLEHFFHLSTLPGYKLRLNSIFEQPVCAFWFQHLNFIIQCVHEAYEATPGIIRNPMTLALSEEAGVLRMRGAKITTVDSTFLNIDILLKQTKNKKQGAAAENLGLALVGRLLRLGKNDVNYYALAPEAFAQTYWLQPSYYQLVINKLIVYWSERSLSVEVFIAVFGHLATFDRLKDRRTLFYTQAHEKGTEV